MLYDRLFSVSISGRRKKKIERKMIMIHLQYHVTEGLQLILFLGFVFAELVFLMPCLTFGFCLHPVLMILFYYANYCFLS